MPDELLNQHVVSAVLLRRWAVEGNVLMYDLRYDYAKPRSPGAEGFISGFTRVGARSFEAKWGAIEERMPAVFEALDGGTVLADSEAVGRLKDFMALHFARSRTMRSVYRRSIDHAMEKLRADGDLRRPERLDELFFLRYGLHPAGPGARVAAYEAALEHIRDSLREGSEFFGERIDDNFGTIREKLESWRLQVGVAEDGHEYVISDDPFQTVDAASGRVGVLSGVPVGEADALIMPLGPRHVVSPAQRDEYIGIDAAGVAKLNSAQFVAAQEKVFMRPGSALDAVRSWRAEQVAVVRHANG